MIHFNVWSGLQRIVTRIVFNAYTMEATSVVIEGLIEGKDLSYGKNRIDEFVKVKNCWYDGVFVGDETNRERAEWITKDRDFKVVFTLASGAQVVRECHFLAECFWTTTPPIILADQFGSPIEKLYDQEWADRYRHNGEWFNLPCCYPEALNTAASTVFSLDEDDKHELKMHFETVDGVRKFVCEPDYTKPAKEYDEVAKDFKFTDYRPCWNIGFLEKENEYYFFGPCVSSQAKPTGKFKTSTALDYHKVDKNSVGYYPILITNERKEFLDLFDDKKEEKRPSISNNTWNIIFYDVNDPKSTWPLIFAQNTTIDVFQKASSQIAYPDFLRALKIVAYLQKHGFEKETLETTYGIFNPDEASIKIPITIINKKWRLTTEPNQLYYDKVEENAFVSEVFTNFSASEAGILYQQGFNKAYITSDNSFTAACYVLSLAAAVNAALGGNETDFFITFDKLAQKDWITYTAPTDQYPACFSGNTGDAKSVDITFNTTSANRSVKISINALTKGSSLPVGDSENYSRGIGILGYDNGASRRKGPDHWIVVYSDGQKVSCLYDPYRSYTALSYGEDVTKTALKAIEDGTEFIYKTITIE